MKRTLMIALLAFSFGLTVGCADGKSNRRAQIAAGKLKTDTGTKKKTDSAPKTDDKGTGGNGNDQTKENPGNQGQKQDVYNQTDAKEIEKKLNELKSEGVVISIDDLKNMTLDLDEVIVSYKLLEDNIGSQKFIAITGGKYDSATDSFQQEETISTGSSKDLVLTGLLTLDHIEFAEDGSTPNIDEPKTLIPMVKNQRLSLIGQEDPAQGASVLEETFQYLLELEPDADGKIQSVETGATINLAQVKKLDGAIQINVEVQATSHQIQTFILKFKVTK